jgi:hypothetical protein
MGTTQKGREKPLDVEEHQEITPNFQSDERT